MAGDFFNLMPDRILWELLLLARGNLQSFQSFNQTIFDLNRGHKINMEEINCLLTIRPEVILTDEPCSALDPTVPTRLKN